MKHTPAPWVVDKNGLSGYGDNGNTFNIKAGRELIASLPSQFRLLDTEDGDSPAYVREEANARLIAAAPDMYEALKSTLSLLRLFTRESDDVAKAVWDQAESALAKANGQTES